MTPEEVAKMQKEMADADGEAEANRKIVEYRMFYSDYKTYEGVKLPTNIQRMIEGLPTEELAFDKIKLNGEDRREEVRGQAPQKSQSQRMLQGSATRHVMPSRSP